MPLELYKPKEGEGFLKAIAMNEVDAGRDRTTPAAQRRSITMIQ
jgi:hypothetical protein